MGTVARLSIWVAGINLAVAENPPASVLDVLHAVADVSVILVFLWGAFRGVFVLATIFKQVTNNGGGSLKDKVDASEAAISRLKSDMSELKAETARQTRTLNELVNHARLRRNNNNHHSNRD